MSKRKKDINIIFSVVFIVAVIFLVVAWWVFWFSNCISGTIGDLPALCILGAK